MSDTPILRALSAVVGANDTAADGELLRRFAEADDRTAFELVVRRHAELVWGVCSAALPRDLHAAEDAFQATFLALARSAASIRDSSVAGWLFRVARNAAVRARVTGARRLSYPLPDELTAVAASAEDEVARREVAPIVAEEIGRLAAKFRDPVVLCFYEGHTHAEAAARLGWPIGTLASRLARAKDVLRDRLTRRGVVLSAVGLTAVLTAPPVTAAPPALLVRAAVAASVGPASRVSPAVLSLTEGVLSAMRFAQLKSFAAFVAVALGLTAALAAIPRNATADPTARAPGAALVMVPAAPTGIPVAHLKDDKNEKAAKELEAKELKALQGNWRVVKLETDGHEVPPEELVKRRLLVEDDVIDMKPNKMRIKLAPGKSPKEIDFTPLDGPNKGKTMPCIYKLDDDKLTLCLPVARDGATRPKEFKADKEIGLTLLERVKDEKEELAALAGEWKPVKVAVSGREIPADELAKGKWTIKGSEVAIVGQGEPEGKATLKLDPSAVPPTIDMTITEGAENEKGMVIKGIYFRQGDKLTIAFSGPKAKKDDRPKELKEGDDVALVVLERAPKK